MTLFSVQRLWRHLVRIPTDHFRLIEQERVLDVSCGIGETLAGIYRHSPSASLYGIDISVEAIAEAKKRHPWGNFTVGKAETLPYKDKEFDMLISRMSLHHYAKPLEALRQMRRVLSDTGTIRLIDFSPNNRWSQKLHNGYGCPHLCHFEKYYTRREIGSMTQEAGLSVVDDVLIGWWSGIRLFTLKKKFN